MGTDTTPASGGKNPNGIVMTSQPANAAAGLRVVDPRTTFSSSAYIWTGPVAATSNDLPFTQKHPAAVLALREWAWLRCCCWRAGGLAHPAAAPM
jgi:hypothetical protein